MEDGEFEAHVPVIESNPNLDEMAAAAQYAIDQLATQQGVTASKVEYVERVGDVIKYKARRIDDETKEAGT